ncbi:Uncharacterized mitochondrial protein AtMg00310 [Linum perenne]
MFNMALLVRQGWRMVQNPDQLWVKLLKGLYFHNVDFLVASKSRYPSWVWSNLCDSRQILWNGELKNLVNGASIRVGEDPWIPTLPDFRLSSSISGSPLANQWFTEDRDHWDLEATMRVCSDREVEEIAKIPIELNHEPDRWVWNLDPRGIFSMRSTYHSLIMARIQLPTPDPFHLDEVMWK